MSERLYKEFLACVQQYCLEEKKTNGDDIDSSLIGGFDFAMGHYSVGELVDMIDSRSTINPIYKRIEEMLRELVKEDIKKDEKFIRTLESIETICT